MAKREKDVNPDEPTNITSQLRPTQLQDASIEVGSFCCNFDPTYAENARLLFLADVPSDRKGDDLAGAEIAVKYWVCTKILIPDRETRTDVSVVRVVLIGPDDEIVSTLSHGILKSVDRMRSTFGDKPYDPPIMMLVKGVSTGTGSDMLMLIPKALESK